MVSKFSLFFPLFSVHGLHSDPNALSYIYITREKKKIYVHIDGNKKSLTNNHET